MEQFQEWTKLSELAGQRKAEWENLQRLLSHAHELDLIELISQVEAINNERRLLDKNNPLVSIQQDLVNRLRKALKDRYDMFKNRYDENMALLTANDIWKKLKSQQQQQILETEGLAAIPEIKTGDAKALLESLEMISLENWKTKNQALPTQFANAALAALKLFEPKTRNVHLNSQILRTQDDVKVWLRKTENELIENVKKGPIIIG